MKGPMHTPVREFYVDEILPTLARIRPVFNVDGGDRIYTVRSNTKKYILFDNNPSCVICGITGNTMVLETCPNTTYMKPHFNLYNRQGDVYTLITQDHIIPRSVGGSNTLSNLQTLCCHCNNLKRSRIITNDELRRLRQKAI